MKGNSKMKIVCIGDSLTYGYGVDVKQSWIHKANDLTQYQLVNCGVPGDVTENMLRRFRDDILGTNVKGIVVMGGSNDILMNLPYDSMVTNLQSILKTAQKAGLKGMWMTPPPVNEYIQNKTWFADRNYSEVNIKLKQLDKEMKSWCNEHQFTVVNLFECINIERHEALYLNDGIHLTPEGHDLLVPMISDSLKEMMK